MIFGLTYKINFIELFKYLNMKPATFLPLDLVIDYLLINNCSTFFANS